MDERWNTHVRPILHVLVEILQPHGAITDRLYAASLISTEDFEKIKACNRAEASRELLILILPRKGPDSFERFLNVLKETGGQEHVAQRIMEEGQRCEQEREENIVSLERELEIQREETQQKEKELKKASQELRKEKVTNIALRNKIAPSMERSPKWNVIDPSMPTHSWAFGRVAEINGILHVADGDRMFQLKEGAWEGENDSLGILVGSLFECEGRGYVMNRGSPSYHQCKSIYEWKSETRALDELTEIPHQNQLKYRSAIGHNGNIYLVGGRRSEGRIDCFHIRTGEWKPITKMTKKRFGCSLTVIDNKMFIGGGGGPGNTVECLLMKGGEWIDIKPTTKEFFQLSSWYGKLVVTGGREKSGKESKCVELYDESLDDWVPLSSMNTGRDLHGACTTRDNQVVVVGGRGRGTSSALGSVECLKL